MVDTTRGQPPRYSSRNHRPSPPPPPPAQDHHPANDAGRAHLQAQLDLSDGPAGYNDDHIDEHDLSSRGRSSGLPNPTSADPASRSSIAATSSTTNNGMPASDSAKMADNDELERFRREWKQEVQSRGGASSAQQRQPAATGSSRANVARSTSNRRVTTDTPSIEASRHLESRASPDAQSFDEHRHHGHHDDEQQDEDDSDVDDLHRNSVQIPEAEIFGPAALKYSKGAHKMPAMRQREASTIPSASLKEPATHDVDGMSADAAVAMPVAGSAATADRGSRFREQVADHAIPFSNSSISGRPLKPKATITGGRIIELDPQAGPSSSRYSSMPAASSSSKRSTKATAPSASSAPPPANGTQSSIKSAVEAYAHAVEMERSGQLDEALISYRRAFKLNSNADRLYHRAQLLLSDPDVAPQQSDALLSSPAVADRVRKALDIDDHRYVAIQERKAKEAQAAERGETYVDVPSSADVTAFTGIEEGRTTSNGRLPPETASTASTAIAGQQQSKVDGLTKLLTRLSVEGGGERDFSRIDFVPEDEEQEVRLARLPDEILVHVLRMVIAPRGRRGAKVAKPKPATTNEEGKAGAGKDGGMAREREKSKAATAAAAASATTATTDGNDAGPTASDSGAAGTAVKAGDVETTDAATATTDKTSSHAVTLAPRVRAVGIGLVLGGCDYASLEMISRVCWKFRLLTQTPSLWKEIVRETYYPPLLDLDATPLASLYQRYHCNWRSVFIHHPRVRLNGCYIAACHYARPGMSEESVWIRVIHVVEFYRSVRFLPDGRCLSLLTTEPPSETVRKLEPGLKAKGFAVGRWQLFAEGLEDDEDEGRPKGPKVVVEDLRDGTMTKYAFRMVFAVRETARGRWNRLELLEYFSVNLTNGETLPLPQKHSKSFHFSRVVPYGI